MNWDCVSTRASVCLCINMSALARSLTVFQNMQHLFLLYRFTIGNLKKKCNELEWASYYAWLYFSEFQNYLACIFNFGTICRLFSFLFKKAKH